MKATESDSNNIVDVAVGVVTHWDGRETAGLTPDLPGTEKDLGVYQVIHGLQYGLTPLPRKTHAHWAIAATAFQPDDTEILRERAILT